MSKKLLAVLSGLIFLSLTCPSNAEPMYDGPDRLSSQESKTQAVRTNSSINWETNLEQAKKEAARDHKLVFWVHMLGNLDGFS